MDYVWAFVIGGLLCLPAQILIDKTKLTPARILVSYVVGGVILGAVGVYEPFVEFAGCGAATPLTGFGYLIARGVKEAVTEKGLLGVLTGGMSETRVRTFDDRQTLVATLKAMAKPGDVILFKGSRGMRMELILEAFLNKET